VVRGSAGLYYDRFRVGLVRDVPAFGGADLRLIQSLAYPQLFNNLTSIIPPLFSALCVNPELTDAEIAAGGVPCPFGPLGNHYGYDHLDGVVAPGYDQLPPGTVVTIDNVQQLTGLTPDEYVAAVTAAAPLLPGQEWFFGPLGMLSSTLLSPQNVPVTLDPAFETPYTRAYHLGFQRMLGRDLVFNLDYHHREFENLLGTRYTNLAFESRVTGRFVFEGGTGILGFGPWYEGTYDAVSLGITKRMSNGFYLSAHYTYTDARDNLLNAQLGGGLSVAGGGTLPSDSYVGEVPLVTDPATGQTNENGSFIASQTGAFVAQAGTFSNGPDLDMGRSGLALEHTVVLYGSVLLGWDLELSGIFRYQSGYPFSQGTLTGLDPDGSGTYNGRDYDYERNSFEGPNYKSLDMRLSRPFSLGGNVVLTALIEVFNLSNEQNPAAVESTPGLPTDFGQPLQVLPGREGQIGLRIEF
jgi:hypothetical protein